MATVTRAQKFRLGLFVGISLAALGFALVMLVGQNILQERDDYLIRFSSRSVSFSGLEVGSPVKYSGLTIGQVRSIQLAADDVGVVEVKISVESGTPIAEDSFASLAVLGITGLKYVELSRGSSQARVRSPGEEIPAGDSLIDELTARAGIIAERLDDILAGVQGMVGEETREDVQKLISESAGILEENRPAIADILTNIRVLTEDLSRVSKSAVSVAAKSDQFMDQVADAGESIATLLSSDGRLIQTIDLAEGLIERVNMMVIRSENDLDIAMRHLREATANLNDFSLAIRDDPRVLLGTGDRGEARPRDGRRGEVR